MKRRAFIELSGVAWVATPCAGQAQPRKLRRIGVLIANNAEIWFPPLRAALRDLGHVEGTSLLVEYRSAEGSASRLAELAAELVQLKVEVIVALQTPAAVAAQRATRDIPIVVSMGDPVGTGLVDSVARPGGNITGFSSTTGELVGKQLELVHEIIPSARRVAALANAPDPFSRPFLAQLKIAALSKGLSLEAALLERADQLEAAFLAMIEKGVDAVVVQGSLPSQRSAQLALRHRLPSVSDNRLFVTAGGLASYSGSFTERNRRVADYVDRILKGARPADLPISQSTLFELAINLKSAAALGLALPPALVQRADEVIE